MESRRPASLIWALLGITLGVLLVYADSTKGAFVFDDLSAIVENPTLRHPSEIGRLIAPPGDEAGSVGGRPLLNLSLAFNYALGGTHAVGYHLVNVAVHLIAAWLLFGIVRRTLDRMPVARETAVPASFLCALLWAMHPLQTESVTYIVQRSEAMAGMFYLGALYCFIRGTEPGAVRGWLWLSVLACLCGVGAKEVLVTAPFVILLYDRTFVAGSFREAWRRRRSCYLGLASSWILLAVLVLSTHGRGGSVGAESVTQVSHYLLTQVRAVAMYLKLSFWPAPLIFDRGTGLVGNAGAVAPQLLFLAAALAATIWALVARPAAGFCGFCFFALLAPTSSFLPIKTEPTAEHRMYLALAPVIALAVIAVCRLARPTRRLMAAALLAAVSFGAMAARRNLDYSSPAALWADTAAKAPDNPRAHNNLAEAYLAANQPARAGVEFAAADRLDPGYLPAQFNLGAMLLDAGKPGEALPHLEKAVSAPLHRAEAQLLLGQALDRLGRMSEGIPHDREALRVAPNYEEADFELGNALAALGRYSEAASAFRRAVDLAPDSLEPRGNLATALMFSGRLDDAIAEYREALRRHPNASAVRANLELALEQKGRGSARPGH